MKKLILICLATGFSAMALAQRGYFLYLQTDDRAPFYVRMADKIYSSSTAGYLIMPNLRDSVYTIGLGFARSTQPETRFAVTINQNDKGFLIKNFGEELALFDLQDLSVIKSVTTAKTNTVYETKTDRFSSVLSKAADDPGLLKVPVAKKEEPKVEPEKKEPLVVKTEEPKPKPEEKEPAKVEAAKPAIDQPKDTAVAKPVELTEPKPEKKEEPVKTEAKPEPAPEPVQLKEESKKEPLEERPANNETPTPYKPSSIIRRSESSTTEGFGIVFLDRMDDRTDTIRVLIPPFKGKLDDTTPVANLSEMEKRTAELSLPASEEKPATTPQKPTAENKDGKTSACKDLASEKDFFKLRRNMAAETNDEAMIAEAKKSFRGKCFSVEQIRYLSTLFLTSAAKYQFFDAAYNHVSDRANFASLQSEIKDEYYMKRFKALVGE